MGVDLEKKRKLLLYPIEYQRGCPCEWVLEFARVGDSAGGAKPLLMMMLFIGTHSVTTTLNVHSRGRSFVGAIDLRGLAPSVRLFRRPNTNDIKK